MEAIQLSKTFASLQKTARGKFIVLGGDPKNKNFLYTNGLSVIIRDIEDPSIADIYLEHSYEVTVAKYSPSGFYICSGDVSGKVRIWDTTQVEHILKYEYQILGGAIKDIDWTEDSKRIAVVGEGREDKGRVFHWDSGTSVGDIAGMEKAANSVSIKPTRPYRLVVASEDHSCYLHQGPPFKYMKLIEGHTNFVNCVRYSPKGQLFISGGADGKALKFDGVSGENKGQLGNPAHKGGIYAISFKPDGEEVITCSGDKTCKIFNTESGEPLVTFEMGKTIPDMQVGCLWQGEHILSVSLSGNINYLDRNNPNTPLRVIKGHNKPINGLEVSDGIIYTSSLCVEITSGKADSHVIWWDASTGNNDEFQGCCHTNDICDMVICENELITVGLDDKIMFSDVQSKQFGTSVGLDSQPKAVAAVPSLTVVACENHVIVFNGHDKTSVLEVGYQPMSVAINNDKKVAIGGAKDDKVHTYNWVSGSLKEDKVIDKYGSTSGKACDMAFSPDGKYLAMAGSDRYVRLFSVPDYDFVCENSVHSGKVFCISWSPDSRCFATGGIDQSIAVFTLDTTKPSKPKLNYHQYKGAHKRFFPKRVKWLDNSTLVSAGTDSHVKQWKINI